MSRKQISVSGGKENMQVEIIALPKDRWKGTAIRQNSIQEFERRVQHEEVVSCNKAL